MFGKTTLIPCRTHASHRHPLSHRLSPLPPSSPRAARDSSFLRFISAIYGEGARTVKQKKQLSRAHAHLGETEAERR